MARILRGDIVSADREPTRGNEQTGQRPVLILSEDVFNDRSGTVIAIALTSQPHKAGFPLTLELLETKLPKRLWAKISQIRTLSVQRLKKKIGKASAGEMDICHNPQTGATQPVPRHREINELVGSENSAGPCRGEIRVSAVAAIKVL